MAQQILKTVRMYDPAISAESDGDPITEFAKTRDLSLLKFMPGMTPVYYHLRLVDNALFTDFVCAVESETERYRRSFRCAVEKVENLKAESGEEFMTWCSTGTQRTESGSQPVLTLEDMKLFAPADQQEIGAVAYWRNFLPRDIGPYFQVPRSSAVVWAAMASQRVERTHDDVAKISAAPKEPAAEVVQAQ
jgi:hypothetical protein